MRPKSGSTRSATRWSFAYAAILGVAAFIQYRIVYSALGPQSLGLWSLLIASVSMGRLAELGLSASILRNVAGATSSGNYKLAAVRQETGVLALLMLATLAVSLLYWPSFKVATSVVDSSESENIPELLLLALLTLVGTLVQSSITAGLDAMMLQASKVKLLLTLQIGYLVAIYPMATHLGIEGVAFAQLVQTFMGVVGAWVLLKRSNNNIRWVPMQFSWGELKEMLGYTLKYQGIMLGVLLVDPLAKVLLAKFCGLASVAHFELANQLIQKLKSPLLAANQAALAIYAGEGRVAIRKAKYAILSNRKRIFEPAVAFLIVIPLLMAAGSLVMTAKIDVEVIILGVGIGLANFAALLVLPIYLWATARAHLALIAIYHLQSGAILALTGYLGARGLGVSGVGVAIALGGALPALYLSRRIARLADFNSPPLKVIRVHRKVILASIVNISCQLILLMQWFRGVVQGSHMLAFLAVLDLVALTIIFRETFSTYFTYKYKGVRRR